MLNYALLILDIFKLICIYRNLLSSQWLSKDDLEKLTVESLSDHDVNKIIYYIIYLILITENI